MEPTRLSVFVAGHRYDTSTAVLLADDAYWDGTSYERDGRNRFLFRTQLRGLYFLLTRSLRKGEEDHVEPLSRAEAEALWEELPRRNVPFSEAFPDSVAASTEVPVLHLDRAVEEAVRLAPGKMKAVVSLRGRAPHHEDEPASSMAAVEASAASGVAHEGHAVAVAAPVAEAPNVAAAADEPDATAAGGGAESSSTTRDANEAPEGKPPDLRSVRARPQSGRRSTSKGSTGGQVTRPTAPKGPEEHTGAAAVEPSDNGLDGGTVETASVEESPAAPDGSAPPDGLDEIPPTDCAEADGSGTEPVAEQESAVAPRGVEPDPTEPHPEELGPLSAAAPAGGEGDLWLDEHGEWQVTGVVRHRTGRLRLVGDELVVTISGESGRFRKRRWTREESVPLTALTAVTVRPGEGRPSLEFRVKGRAPEELILEDCRPAVTIAELVDLLAARVPEAAVQRLG